MAEGALNESDILKYIINDDIDSVQKKNMQKGERYYNGEHDVLQKDFRISKILETDEQTEKEIIGSREKRGNSTTKIYHIS